MCLIAQGDQQASSGREEGGPTRKMFRNPTITGKKIRLFGFVVSLRSPVQEIIACFAMDEK
jgi:hypothetical protein